jgi:hypothetical protein
VVLEERRVRRTPGPRPVRPPERELLEAVAREYAERGYRTYVDPDGSDYFDLAVRREEEVGLIEGKLAGASEVLGQALRRRPWADWVAVVLASERSAQRLIARTTAHRASVVGVWACSDGRARELRPPTSCRADPEDPFEEHRRRFRQHLLDLDRGVLPAGVRWSSVVGEVRRASAGRGFSEWRLDELDGGSL